MIQNEVKLTTEQKKYIKLVLEPKIKNEKGQFAYGIVTSWDYIAGQRQKGQNDEKFKEKGKTIKKIHKYNNIDEWLAKKIYKDKNKINEVKNLKEKFAIVKNRWDTQKHRTGFEDVEKCKDCIKEANEDDYEKGKYGFKTFENFYKWYQRQYTKNGKKHCYYCGATEVELKQLFKEKNDESERNKPLYSKKRSFTATLQIDRQNPDDGYNDKNCVLACTFCNNAKSDMVKEKGLIFFEKNFKKFVRKFYKYLLSSK